MTARGRRSVRREPQQDRSREMVERILQAGADVLLERGYDGASTNRIADRAGISPGSLYQYFPDKAAILDLVMDRFMDRMETRISAAFLGTLASGSLRTSVRASVTALLDVFAEHRAMLRVTVERLPRSADSRRRAYAGRIDQLLATALLHQPGGPEGRPVDAVAWIVVRAAEHVTISYTLEQPDIPREVVVDELTELVVRYLSAAPPARWRDH